jgi:hypothetical protein
MDNFIVSDNDDRHDENDDRTVKITRTRGKYDFVWSMSQEEARALHATLGTYLTGDEPDDEPTYLDDAIRAQISEFTEGRQIVTGWIVTTIAQDPYDQKNDMYRCMSAPGQSSALSIGLAQMTLDYMRSQLETTADNDDE